MTSKLSLFQAEKSQSSLPCLAEELLQPSNNLGGPPQDPHQQINVLFVLGIPELDAGRKKNRYKLSSVPSLHHSSLEHLRSQPL